MSELKEVFDMVTKQKEPDQDSWKQQEERQRRTARNRRWGAFALVAAMLATAMFVFVVSRPKDENSVGNTSPGSQKVPFVTTAPIGAQIVAVDGTPLQQFPASFSGANGLALSPDGATIAYMLGGDVHTVTVDGTIDRTLTQGGGPFHGDGLFHLSWSPDGGMLTYSWNDNIYVMNADGSGKQRLTSSPPGHGSYYPTWSRDGSTIVYWSGSSTGRDGGPLDAEIYTIPAIGGTPTRLTSDAVSDYEPTWSPDGTQIAYWHGAELWVMGADGGQAHRVYRGKGGAWAPSWSSDGTKIAFLSYDPSERSISDQALLQVRVLTLATGEVSRLHVRVATDLNGPTWTPGGELFVNRYD